MHQSNTIQKIVLMTSKHQGLKRLIEEWLNEPGDYDATAWPEIEQQLKSQKINFREIERRYMEIEIKEAEDREVIKDKVRAAFSEVHLARRVRPVLEIRGYKWIDNIDDNTYYEVATRILRSSKYDSILNDYTTFLRALMKKLPRKWGMSLFKRRLLLSDSEMSLCHRVKEFYFSRNMPGSGQGSTFKSIL